MKRQASRWTGLVTLGCALTMLAACGQTKMIATTGKIRQHMVANNYPAALATLRQAKKKKAFKEQDRVMFWMDEGMILHLLGRYKESNQVLERAEQRSEELFTKSIRKNMVIVWIASIFVNIGMWFERFVITITSLHRDFLPSSWEYFSPTAVDILMLVGSFGLFFTLFLLFLRFLPLVAMAEVKTVMPQAVHGGVHEGESSMADYWPDRPDAEHRHLKVDGDDTPRGEG